MFNDKRVTLILIPLLLTIIGVVYTIRTGSGGDGVPVVRVETMPIVSERDTTNFYKRDSVLLMLAAVNDKLNLVLKNCAQRKDTLYFVSTIVDTSAAKIVYQPVIREVERIPEEIELKHRVEKDRIVVWSGNIRPLTIPLKIFSSVPWYRRFYFPVSVSGYGNSDLGAAVGVGYKRAAITVGATTIGREIRFTYSFGGAFDR